MTDSKMTQEIPEVSPKEAAEILKTDSQSVLLDVRCRVEFDYVGHPPGAINIPWQEPPSWEVVPDFYARVQQRLGELRADIPPAALTVLALCRSGGRSRDAARELARHGFSKVINIAEGFEGGLDENRHRGNIGGWRYHQLPWEQT
jgi:rhodanese-related sulfurtransferase